MSAARRALIPVSMLAAFAALAVTSLYGKSPTVDEIYHLASGYSYLATGQFELAIDHPPLVKMLAAAPLLLMDLAPAAQTPGWSERDRPKFEGEFAYHNRAPLRRMLFFARLPIVALGVALGAVVFLWACELWGYWPGVFVLFLYVLCPNILAHTRLVTTDLGVTCFSVMAVYAAWKFRRSGSLVHVLWCALALAAALLSKYSAAVTALVAAALLGVEAYRRAARGPGGAMAGWRRVAAVGLIVAAVVLLSITVTCGFPHGLETYYRGVRQLLADFAPAARTKPSFLWGRYSDDGFWDYYLLAQLWKTPLPTLVFFAVSLFVLARDRSRWGDAAYLLAPIAGFHLAAMTSSVDIGVRHVLPTFPFVLLTCGAAARRLVERRLPVRVGFAALCVWLLVGTLRVYPHFLPYFNELAGGPDGGIRYLDDSNIDWGQDFYGLAGWVAARQPAEMRVSLFGTRPGQDLGFPSRPILLRDLVWPRPGTTYAVSADILQRRSFRGDNTALRFRWLDRYRPVDKIGWSIFLYRFSIDPRQRDDPATFYIPRERWYADAIEQLDDILVQSPGFDEARRLRAAVAAARAAGGAS